MWSGSIQERRIASTILCCLVWWSKIQIHSAEIHHAEIPREVLFAEQSRANHFRNIAHRDLRIVDDQVAPQTQFLDVPNAFTTG